MHPQLDLHLHRQRCARHHVHPKATVYEIWTAIHDQFCDNELHHAVYLEAEFRNLVQGDMDITQYTRRLKQLADALHDVGQPVRETSQVLNMLRGLNPKFRHVILVITSKQPPHTFFSARSFLLLEECYDNEHIKMASHQALVAPSGSRPPTAPSPGPGDVGAPQPHQLAVVATSSCPDNHGNKKRRGHGTTTSSSGSTNNPHYRNAQVCRVSTAHAEA